MTKPTNLVDSQPQMPTRMSTMPRRRALIAGGGLLLAGLLLSVPVLQGVAHAAGADENEAQAALRQRAVEYWRAKELHDLATLYHLEAAALPGGWLSAEKVASGWPSRNVKITAVKIDGQLGLVGVTMETKIGIAPFKPRTFDDKWVLVDGKWYHDTYNPQVKKWYHETAEK